MPPELKPHTPVYEIDGALVHSLADFYRLIGDALPGSDGPFQMMAGGIDIGVVVF